MCREMEESRSRGVIHATDAKISRDGLRQRSSLDHVCSYAIIFVISSHDIFYIRGVVFFVMSISWGIAFHLLEHHPAITSPLPPYNHDQ